MNDPTITITHRQFNALVRGAMANYAEDIGLAPMYRTLDADDFHVLQETLVEVGQITKEQAIF